MCFLGRDWDCCTVYFVCIGWKTLGQVLGVRVIDQGSWQGQLREFACLSINCEVMTAFVGHILNKTNMEYWAPRTSAAGGDGREEHLYQAAIIISCSKR